MKFFLVEDSPAIRGRLRTLISEVAGGEVVAEADNQESALKGIAETLPDVVTLDLHLASGSSMAVLRQVKAMHPGIKVIVLAAVDYPQYRQKCLAIGADYFLDKSRDIGLLSGLLAGLANESCTYQKSTG